MTAADDLH